jgi:hypothetical protein
MFLEVYVKSIAEKRLTNQTIFVILQSTSYSLPLLTVIYFKMNFTCDVAEEAVEDPSHSLVLLPLR